MIFPGGAEGAAVRHTWRRPPPGSGEGACRSVQTIAEGAGVLVREPPKKGGDIQVVGVGLRLLGLLLRGLQGGGPAGRAGRRGGGAVGGLGVGVLLAGLAAEQAEKPPFFFSS
jgi:hypothetical protein